MSLSLRDKLAVLPLNRHSYRSTQSFSWWSKKQPERLDVLKVTDSMLGRYLPTTGVATSTSTMFKAAD